MKVDERFWFGEWRRRTLGIREKDEVGKWLCNPSFSLPFFLKIHTSPNSRIFSHSNSFSMWGYRKGHIWLMMWIFTCITHLWKLLDHIMTYFYFQFIFRNLFPSLLFFFFSFLFSFSYFCCGIPTGMFHRTEINQFFFAFSFGNNNKKKVWLICLLFSFSILKSVDDIQLGRWSNRGNDLIASGMNIRSLGCIDSVLAFQWLK